MVRAGEGGEAGENGGEPGVVRAGEGGEAVRGVMAVEAGEGHAGFEALEPNELPPRTRDTAKKPGGGGLSFYEHHPPCLCKCFLHVM